MSLPLFSKEGHGEICANQIPPVLPLKKGGDKTVSASASEAIRAFRVFRAVRGYGFVLRLLRRYRSSQ